MKLSIVDIAPIQAGTSATEAFQTTKHLAPQAESAGYSRFWVAEHHGMAESIASSTPEVLIAHLAAHTETITIGSGTILLNHYSPFKVAETFSVLDALAPGRIDLGLGRATGIPAVDLALRSGKPQRESRDHEAKITEVLDHLYGSFAPDHPYHDISMPRAANSTPDVWVLGSSPHSAAIAGTLGLPYAFAAFIRPTVAKQALTQYRASFSARPEYTGRSEPYSILAVNIACAETDHDAARLRASAEAAYQRMATGMIGPPPTVDEAIEELGSVPDPTPQSLAPEDWPRAISGSPDTLASLLPAMLDAVGADELMVQNLIEDPADRIRSHVLLAEALLPSSA